MMFAVESKHRRLLRRMLVVGAATITLATLAAPAEAKPMMRCLDNDRGATLAVEREVPPICPPYMKM